MPTHPAHIAAQSHQFGLQLGPDKGTDLESLMIQRAGARVLEIPGRCGFAQFAPRGAKQIIGLVEVHVILLAEIDRVTLMTCTPYGVNTHRLLISGHRVAIPMPAPEPNDVLDARNIALGVGLGILAAGLFIIWLARRHKAARIIRHGAFWPWMRRKGESANDTLA